MKSLKQNFIFNSLYQIMVIAIPLITRPYISRILRAEGIGIYAYANSIAYYFVLFAHLGLNNYGNRAIARVRDDKGTLSKEFCSIYALQLITSCISTIIYLLYIYFVSTDRIVSSIMLVYVISAGIDINWFFFGLEEFKFTAIRSMFIKLLTVIAIFIFVKSKSDVYVYCIIYVTGMILSQVLLWTRVRRYIDFKCPSNAEIFKHLKPNLVLFIPVIAVSLYKIMDKIMLGSMATKTEVGYYESCEAVIQIPIALVNSLGAVMLPRISNLVARKDDRSTILFIEKSLIVAVFLSSSMGFGIMGVSKEFVPFFYGNGFEKCVHLFQVLMPSCLFLAFANVVRTQYLIPYQRDKEYICSVFIGAAVNLCINALLIPSYGSVGAAIGTLLAEFSVCATQCLMVRKELKIDNYIIATLPFVFSAILMYEILFHIFLPFGYFFSLIVKILLGVAVYFVVLWMLEQINKYFFRKYYIDLFAFGKKIIRRHT